MKKIFIDKFFPADTLNKFISKLLIVYFYLCFLFPLELNLLYVKIVLLSIICILIISFKPGNLKLIVPRFIVFYFAVFALPILLGLGQKDFFKPFLNFFILPIVYVFIFSNIIISFTVFRKLIFSAFYFSVFISMLLFFGLISSEFGTVIFLESKYSYNPELVEFTFPQMNILPFVVPFIISELYNSQRKYIFIVLCFLLFSFVILLGRSGILFALLFAVLSILWKKVWNIVFFIPPLLVGIYFLLPVINVDLNPSALTRQVQFFELVNYWLNNPFLGNGLGAHPEFIRSEANPSSYELFYLSLLNQIGVVGMILFLIFLFSKYHFLIKIRLKTVWFGILGVLLASFTNPYLDRFDFIFILFLPILFVYEKTNESSFSY